MEEIKFRGKRINKRWEYGSLVIDEEWAKYYIYYLEQRRHDICPTLYHCEVDPETIGQLTCSKDKNGKKIYDGDVWVVYSKETEGKELERLIIRINSASTFKGWRSTQGEVIGNIHDNKDLLKGEGNAK